MAKRSSSVDTPAAKRARAKTALPTVPAEKVLEARSRSIFNDALSPWLVTEWAQHDYGVDAIVELTRARDSGNFDATGKRFAVQLKATADDVSSRDAAPVRVRPEHVRYWLESTEPVLLALCHVPSRRLFWRWIDHSVVDELNRRDPAWIGQETVTLNISLSQRLDELARTEIATFVTGFRRSAQRVLAPGRYLELYTRLSSIAAELTRRAGDAGFESVTKRLVDLERAIRTSTYVIALAGPARAGKSTLLNALVGRDVSPVGRLPTTAVSLVVMAGAHDEVEVVLASDERIRGDATPAFLAHYATQEENPDNCKGVRMVAVRLVNELLERGIAYADTPGLHDASAEIRAVTETALKAAHAVLYVLDVSPARNGGFSLSTHQLDDLKRLHTMADRLFVVLNKADVLSEIERSEIASYIQNTLKKYALWESLPVPPIFLSASAGWSWHQSGRTDESPLVHLEAAMWTYLLQTNSTGLDRLRFAATELRHGGGEFASLLASRRLSGAEAHRLQAALEQCRRTEGNLVSRCRNERAPCEGRVARQLEIGREALVGDLRHVLESVPVDQPLPTGAQLERAFHSNVLQIVSAAWVKVVSSLESFASLVSLEVERSLQQARLATGHIEAMAFQLPQIPKLNIAEDSLQEAWTGLFTGGLFGLILGGPWAWALAAGGWIAGVVFNRERRRKREIAHALERTRISLNEAFDAVLKQVREKIGIYLGALERRVTDRISVFVHDVELQLKKHDVPISPEEACRLEEHEHAVRATLVALHDASSQLMLEGDSSTPTLGRLNPDVAPNNVCDHT